MSDGLEKSGSGQARPVSPCRRWSEARKRRIVAESYQPGVSVSVVARRHDVNANLVPTWRRRFCDGDRAEARAAGRRMLVLSGKAGKRMEAAEAGPLRRLADERSGG